MNIRETRVHHAGDGGVEGDRTHRALVLAEGGQERAVRHLSGKIHVSVMISQEIYHKLRRTIIIAVFFLSDAVNVDTRIIDAPVALSAGHHGGDGGVEDNRAHRALVLAEGGQERAVRHLLGTKNYYSTGLC